MAELYPILGGPESHDVQEEEKFEPGQGGRSLLILVETFPRPSSGRPYTPGWAFTQLCLRQWNCTCCPTSLHGVLVTPPSSSCVLGPSQEDR